MRWVVQKYGGTSVGKFPEMIANDIVAEYSKEYRVVVVCSARSTGTKSEGTTTRLLQSAEVAMKNGDYQSIIDAVRQDHLEAARKKIVNQEIAQQLAQDIDRECDHLERLLAAAQVVDEVSTRTLDTIMAAGEKLSCQYMAALMRSEGQNAVYVDLSKIIPPTVEGPVDEAFYGQLIHKMTAEVERAVNDDPSVVPVVTGFFGVIPGGLLDTVGRGYTDLCAALIAVGLKAEELQIWKEVDGIFTADPRKVPTARLLSRITPEEAAELTYYGSEVIHPFTMQQVIKARIPIRIKNVMNPKGNGTIVFPDNDSRPGEATPPHPPAALERIPSQFFKAPKLPTAVTTKHNIIVLNVHSNKKSQSHGFLAKVFTILDKWKLVVDLISTSEVHVSMALHSSLTDDLLKEAVAELRHYGTVDVTRKLCIISLVGKQMKQLVGIAGKMFSTLGEAGVNLEMISQGASEINISCVIEEKDALKALNVLHQRLLTM